MVKTTDNKDDENDKLNNLTALYDEKWINSFAKEDLDQDTQIRIHLSIHDQINKKKNDYAQAQLPKNRKKRIRLFSSIAAACLVIFIYSGHLFLTSRSNELNDKLQVKVEKGQKVSLELPDGTIVWLNSDSKLVYNNMYNKSNRTLDLEGEAFFEVKKSKIPFVVNVGDLHVEALGTSFNVKSYFAENSTTVTLVEGRLRINGKDVEKILDPNMRIKYDKKSGLFDQIEKCDSAYKIGSWMDNELILHDESLESLAATLSRIYNVEFEFSDEDLKSFRFSGTIKNNSLHNVLNIVSQTIPVDYNISNNKVRIFLINY